jgi:hypothetical protein
MQIVRVSLRSGMPDLQISTFAMEAAVEITITSTARFNDYSPSMRVTALLQQWARLARVVLCTARDDGDHLQQAQVRLFNNTTPLFRSMPITSNSAF